MTTNNDDDIIVRLRLATDAEQRRALITELARRDVAAGAGHECDEWRDQDADRRCALCGRPPDHE